jgi:hypothetical protein
MVRVRVRIRVRVRVRVRFWVSVIYYVIKVVPDSFRIHVFSVKWSHIRGTFPWSSVTQICHNGQRSYAFHLLSLKSSRITQYFNELQTGLSPINDTNYLVIKG